MWNGAALTIGMPYEDLVFRLVDDSIINPLGRLSRSSPASVECIDFGQLRSEEEARGTGADNEDVCLGFGHDEPGRMMGCEGRLGDELWKGKQCPRFLCCVGFRYPLVYPSRLLNG